MEADCFFRMGSTHSVCQDYAATDVSTGGVCVAVSDGCSSAPDTDFGARFMVRAALMEPEHLYASEILTAACRMRVAARLQRSSLQATLLVASCFDEFVRVCRAGDGVVVWRDRDGTVSYEQVAYDNNTPAYLSYGLNDEDTKQFLASVPGRTVSSGTRTPDGYWWIKEDVREPAALSWEVRNLRVSDVDLVLLFSDGIESFQASDGSVVPVETILDELLSIKNFKGQFLARRCSSYLARTCGPRGWKHADDFSVAGIYLGEQP